MLENNTVAFRNVKDISPTQLNEIKIFLQGTVKQWCAEHSYGDQFCLRNLVGGRNKDWNGTPLQVLYDKHNNNGSKNPYISAARDAGSILKKVLDEEKEKFKIINDKNTRSLTYIWIK